ncbi:hypothetical protein [Chryseobacterium carnipullorum]|uniref:Cell wall anchor protein n=1 Tax=Chryseobacterium carnipullorum TaxID=1124835 RepID=A0A376EHI1_CHRCU|nr:hypothetical protein [Chryseobacterium carnipullorum]STD08544.1 Uncharacterised protein [Chryseobacterium carnipullorum]
MNKITLSFFSLLSIVSVAQSLSPTGSITAPGSADNFKGGYTFAYATSGTPWNGSLISFGGFTNQYDTQISSAYNGNSMSFRTRNGDFNVWNSWNELATKGANDFMGKQTIMGNVGIGTQAPSEKLTVSGDHQNSIILLHSSGDGVNSPANLSLWASEPQETYTGVGIGNNVRNYGTGQSFPRINTNLGGSYIRLLENHINFNLISNTGIKKQIATLYSDRFEVNTPIYSKESSNEGGALVLENPSKTSGNIARKWALYNMTGSYGNSLQFWSYSSDGASYGSKLKISDDGNMALYGKFEAKEVKVTLTPTADFVFDENYNLPKLEEIEKHIKEKKHLPEIASAAQMEKEGVNIGEFQIKLLQKIEELTLYTIEQNKQLKKLQENNDKLMNEVEELKAMKK